MDSNYTTHNKIWSEISGGAALYAVYGFWPSLHDAIIEKIAFMPGGDTVEMTLKYSDMVDDIRDVRTRFRMRWEGVTKCDFSIESFDLYGATFSIVDGYILTEFTKYPWGFDGSILAKSISVNDLVMVTEEENERQGDTRGVIEYRAMVEP